MTTTKQLVWRQGRPPHCQGWYLVEINREVYAAWVSKENYVTTDGRYWSIQVDGFSEELDAPDSEAVGFITRHYGPLPKPPKPKAKKAVSTT